MKKSLSSDLFLVFAKARSVGVIKLSAVLALGGLASNTVYGQEERRANRLMEEVVVTAQKREESSQDVPIAILAYSSEKLDALGIDSAQDLEKITPGFTVTNAVGYSVAYMRGVGTDAFLPGADPSVPFYIDGVPLLGSQGSSDTLGRVERVEVLKGPQGTLFGRNATGGAVNIITPSPGEEFTGDIKVEFGSRRERNILGYVEVPVTENIAFSLSAFENRRDNYYTNNGTKSNGEPGPDLFDITASGVRLKARWDITESLVLSLAASTNDVQGNAGLNYENTRVSALGNALGMPEDPKADRRVKYDSQAGATNESELASITLEWFTNLFDVKLIASDQEVDAPFVQADFDKSELELVNITSIVQLSEQKTAEFQLLSNENTWLSDKFEWVFGLFYLESSGGFDPIAFDIKGSVAASILATQTGAAGQAVLDITNALGIDLGGVVPDITLYAGGVLDSEAESAYFQGTYFVLPELSLTAGIRHQEEERNLLNSRLSAPDGEGGENIIRADTVPQLDASQTSARVAIQWFPFGEDIQLYTSWGKTFKSPTYNTVNLLDTPESVEEEEVNSYELGFKSTLLDGNLRLNGAVFHIQQKNLLTGFVALTSGGVVTYDNAGSAEIDGAELDFVWSPMPNLNPGLVVAGAGSYLDTEYTDYTNGRGYDEEDGLVFGEGTGNARDFTGNRIVRTPKFTSTIALNQSIIMPDGTLELGLDYYYNSGFFFNAQNSDLYARDQYRLFNARVSYFFDDVDLQVTLFGENIMNEQYNEVVFVDDFGRNQVLNSPDIYGVRVKYTF